MIPLSSQISVMEREIERLKARAKWQLENEPGKAERTEILAEQMSCVLQTLTQLRGLAK